MLLRASGNYLNAIEIAKEIFQEFQKLGDLVSSFDALLIQAYSHMIMINLIENTFHYTLDLKIQFAYYLYKWLIQITSIYVVSRAN